MTARALPRKPLLSQLSRDTRIGVVCGGLSEERAVSLRSGANCLEALHRLGYHNAVLIDADRTIAHQLQAAQIELAFIVLHGAFGEDGAIQGLLQWLDLPYTGSPIAAHAIAINKRLTKQFLRPFGLPVLPDAVMTAAPWQGMSPETQAEWAQATCAALPGAAWITKPTSQGSSVGMQVVDSAAALRDAVSTAFTVDDEVLVEPYLQGASLTVGVFQRTLAHAPEATPILELRVKDGWYDYEAKYTPGKTEFILPAPLPEALTQQLQAQSVAAFEALGCCGAIRVDWIVDQASGAPYLLEVNTLPGMTNTSDLPAQAQAIGVSFDALVDSLVQSATVPLATPSTPLPSDACTV